MAITKIYCSKKHILTKKEVNFWHWISNKYWYILEQKSSRYEHSVNIDSNTQLLAPSPPLCPRCTQQSPIEIWDRRCHGTEPLGQNPWQPWGSGTFPQPWQCSCSELGFLFLFLFVFSCTGMIVKQYPRRDPSYCSWLEECCPFPSCFRQATQFFFWKMVFFRTHKVHVHRSWVWRENKKYGQQSTGCHLSFVFRYCDFITFRILIYLACLLAYGLSVCLSFSLCVVLVTSL